MQPGELLPLLVDTQLKHDDDNELLPDDLLLDEDRLKEFIDGEDSQEDEGEATVNEKVEGQKP